MGAWLKEGEGVLLKEGEERSTDSSLPRERPLPGEETLRKEELLGEWSVRRRVGVFRREGEGKRRKGEGGRLLLPPLLLEGESRRALGWGLRFFASRSRLAGKLTCEKSLLTSPVMSFTRGESVSIDKRVGVGGSRSFPGPKFQISPVLIGSTLMGTLPHNRKRQNKG